MDNINRDKIIKQHMGMIYKIANQHAPQKAQHFEDLIIEGMIAVNDSIDRFDASKGVSFGTFVYGNIAGRMKHYLRDNVSLCRITRHNKELNYKIIKLKNKDNNITIEEIADELNISVELVSKIINASNPTSIDYQLSENDEGNHKTYKGDILIVNDNVEQEVIDNEVIKDLIDKLKPRQQKVAKMIVYGYEQNEIAKILDVSPSTICRDIKRIKKVLSN